MTTIEPGSQHRVLRRFLLDVAIMAFAAAGMVAPWNPIIATLAFSALCYFAARFWLAVGPGLMARLFPGNPDLDLEDEDADEPMNGWGEPWR